MKKWNEWMDVPFTWLRQCLHAILSSEGLFLVAMLLYNEVLSVPVLLNHTNLTEPIHEFILMPWSGALLGIYLTRKNRRSGLDIRALTLLILWISVPFILRFGTEYLTLYAIWGYSICFFVSYASICTQDAHSRARQLNRACALICLFSFIWGGALLYCVLTGNVLCSYPDTPKFGVVSGVLSHSTNRNMTAIIALICMFFCLTGFCRSRKTPFSILYLPGAVIMALVVVLTQSRTSRYALLISCSLGTWNALNAHLPTKKPLLRQMIAIACAAVVLIGGYLLCSFITDTALVYYTALPASDLFNASIKARSPMDSTFSYRTTLWKILFMSWKENPWHMLIGNGFCRTRWILGSAFLGKGAMDAHNAFLQFAAEFGLIGFAPLFIFLCTLIKPVLRVFFSHGKARMPGGCALCMLAFSLLIIGLMESCPLEPMKTPCLVLFFVLGQLAGAGRDMKTH